MASGAPLGTRLSPRQWMAIDAAVSVAMLAVLTGVAVSRHPGHSHTVVVRYDDNGAVVVEVTDDGRSIRAKRGDGGHGLAGMRERVSLLGGELLAGPRAGGGYRVVARLPAEAGAR